MSEAVDNGTALVIRVAHLEAESISSHNNISALIANGKVLTEAIAEVRTTVNASLAKLNVLENLMHMMRESLFTPEHKRKKVTVVKRVKK